MHEPSAAPLATVQVDAEVRRLGGRVTARDGGTATAFFGSRLALRLYGVFLRAGRSALPMKAELSWRQNGATTVIDVLMTSDEGWFLYRIQALLRAYDADFAAKAQALWAATTPAPRPAR